MSQKLPFNNVPSLFEIPEGDPPRIFHRFAENPGMLWELHLWLATNAGGDAAPANIAVSAVGPFGGPALLATAFVPDPAGPPRVEKIADGIPLRGPMSLQISADSVDAKLPMLAFGYVLRGAPDIKPERRFFDPGSDIGDQQTAFQGGTAIVLPANSSVDVHETSETHLDEITLDMRSPTDGMSALISFVGGANASEGGIGILLPTPADGKIVRILDGIPVRDAGILTVATAQVTGTRFFNGHFLRG